MSVFSGGAAMTSVPGNMFLNVTIVDLSTVVFTMPSPVVPERPGPR